MHWTEVSCAVASLVYHSSQTFTFPVLGMCLVALEPSSATEVLGPIGGVATVTMGLFVERLALLTDGHELTWHPFLG